jgi:hypothetical protein
MTKQTNYVATVEDANSVFPPKGGAIPDSNRGLISADAGQTQGSVGAKDHWYIKTDVEPIASYPNNRLPRWQDLIPLSCGFTIGTVQVPDVDTPVLDSTTAITIFFDASGSMNEVLPSLQYMQNTLLKPCLLPYYNNDVNLYNQRVTVLSIGSGQILNERTIAWLGELPPNGATKVVNLAFSNESFNVYTTNVAYSGAVQNVNTSVSPWTFINNVQPTSSYTTDINYANVRLSSNLRGIIYRLIFTDETSGTPAININNVTKQFYQAVFTGQGNYAGASGLSTNGYAYLIDDVAALGLPGTSTATAAQYYTNKVIEGMNLLGYNLSPC